LTARILTGDCRTILPTLDAGSVHCVVTSPPYFNLRSYLPNGHADKDREIGSESSLDEYITTLVEVFREVRRVLRPEGSLWLNCGDSYASAWPCNRRSVIGNGSLPNGKREARPPRLPGGLKEKDLMMVPARVALALQADGWYLRSDIIWHKPNPMPESVTDRPTSSHEHVFLLTKKPRYYFDMEAVKEQSDPEQVAHNLKYAKPYEAYDGRAATTGQPGNVNNVGIHARPGNGDGKRNLRNVWRLGPQSFSQAHFATFPTTLVEPCIKAGTSEKGCCAACGAPWTRVVEREQSYDHVTTANGKSKDGPYAKQTGDGVGTHDIRHGVYSNVQTIGWQPSCHCNAGEPIPCTVLDPFMGAGTVALVADRLGRESIGIELSATYAQMARDRIYGDAPLFADVVTT
jgi:DNA modification methylase